MKNLYEIQQDRRLINRIDWEMTPEEAVRLYLEWGNNWAGGNYVIRSKNDVSYYFVVDTWGDKPTIRLVRRNSEIAEDLADIEMPAELKDRFLENNGRHKGIYAPDADVKRWLRRQLNAD